MAIKLTTKQFIDKARLIHGTRYDYSPTIYETQSDKVKINCPTHGLFEQRADHHLGGHGCIKCAGRDRYTTKAYIDKAKNVHNDKYDYSRVNYQNANTKITIICPVHGLFEQSPSRHLSGSGCPKCGGSLKLDTSDFIAKARQVHGSRYDYSDVVYKNSQTKVKIACPEHGPFEQAPNHHLHGKGCRDCSYKLRGHNQSMGTDKFIQQARSVHGTLYDYSLVKYANSVTPVIIVCSKHGAFRQLPLVHLRPAGCRKCSHHELSLRRKRTTAAFISKARELHGNKYDYSPSIYLSATEKITIICSKHGSFEQVAHSHLIGAGCNKCADIVRADKKRSNTEEFIIKAREVHGTRYDYSKVVYINSLMKITIICPDHGIFDQRPYNHLTGMGCPGCAHTGVDLTAPGLLYYLRIETVTHALWKIGITNRTIEKRFMKDMRKITIIKSWPFDRLEKGFRREQQILNKHAAHRYCGKEWPLMRGGNTELFIKDVLGLDKSFI